LSLRKSCNDADQKQGNAVDKNDFSVQNSKTCNESTSFVLKNMVIQFNIPRKSRSMKTEITMEVNIWKCIDLKESLNINAGDKAAVSDCVKRCKLLSVAGSLGVLDL
jgi:hypothetical protein